MIELERWLEGAPTQAVTLESILLAMLLALIVGQLIAWCYIWTHNGAAYSRNFAQSLILLCLILAMVMTVVGSNALIAFGLLVAISMIRFRTPVRDTRDMTFVFLSLAAGLAIGTGFLGLAVLCTVAICTVAGYLHLTDFGARSSRGCVLQFQGPRAAIEGEAVRTALLRHCRRWRLLSIMPLTPAGKDRVVFDSAYEVELRDEHRSAALLSELLKVDDLGGITFVSHQEREEP